MLLIGRQLLRMDRAIEASQALRSILGALAGNSQTLMFLVCTVVFLIIGCFLDTASAALLLTPIVIPAVTSLGSIRCTLRLS